MRKLIAGAVLAVVMLAGVAMPGTAFADVHGPPLDTVGCEISEPIRLNLEIMLPDPPDLPDIGSELCFVHPNPLNGV